MDRSVCTGEVDRSVCTGEVDRSVRVCEVDRSVWLVRWTVVSVLVRWTVVSVLVRWTIESYMNSDWLTQTVQSTDRLQLRSTSKWMIKITQNHDTNFVRHLKKRMRNQLTCFRR